MAAATKKKITKKAAENVKEDFYNVILTPMITEKSMKEMQERNKYTIKVAKDSNKIQIKEAFEAIFNVKVVSINVVNVRAKAKKVGRYEGTVGAYKKAIIALAPGETVDLMK